MEREAADSRPVAAAAEEMDLVRRVRARDPVAYEELCERFGTALHGFAAARLMDNGELAEDVVVQTMTDAVRNIGRFDARRSSLGPWLYGIARRKIHGERRKLLRRKSVPQSAQTPIDELREVAAAEDVAAGVASQVDAERKVAELDELLSDIEMEVLVLHCVDGFSVSEIGGIVGRSTRAVDSVLHRARTKARERLVELDGQAE